MLNSASRVRCSPAEPGPDEDLTASPLAVGDRLHQLDCFAEPLECRDGEHRRAPGERCLNYWAPWCHRRPRPPPRLVLIRGDSDTAHPRWLVSSPSAWKSGAVIPSWQVICE
jgi:hypothetical protein